MKNILAFRTNKDWDKLQNNTIIDKGHWGRNCKRRSLVHLLLLSKESIKNQHWFASGMDQCKHYKILHLLSDSILWKVQFGIHYMVITRKIIRQVVGWLVSGIVLQLKDTVILLLARSIGMLNFNTTLYYFII